ncbi:MAG: geranylgeranyl reductase [Candidatus Rokuibacteriota bacterium]|nr:MAG: geranylgeranyl reductase [Candidatus Rokubacteria bacterium]
MSPLAREAETNEADVLIIGGGPAGSMAGIALARRGVRARLLDRHRFPRDKPCGGGIRWSVLRRFPDLAPYLAETVPLHEIRRVIMESPSRATVCAESEDPLYLTLRRVDFDAALLQRARTVGVDVIEGARVTDVHVSPGDVLVRCIDGREFRARILIGADGVNSVVARATGLGDGVGDDRLAIDTMEETPRDELWMKDPESLYVAYGYQGYAGYGYVFPKKHHVDAGVGFLVSFYKRKIDASPARCHARFLEDARARGVVMGRSNPDNVKAYRLPLGGPLSRTYADRVLLCGDAGGFVNAYTGEGIYFAMVTGVHAGETAAIALHRGDTSARTLSEYERRWRAEIGEELGDSVRIQRRLFANPALADRVIRAAAVDRKLCRLFARIALGEESLRRRKLTLVWRFALASLRVRLRQRTARAERS